MSCGTWRTVCLTNAQSRLDHELPCPYTVSCKRNVKKVHASFAVSEHVHRYTCTCAGVLLNSRDLYAELVVYPTLHIVYSVITKQEDTQRKALRKEKRTPLKLAEHAPYLSAADVQRKITKKNTNEMGCHRVQTGTGKYAFIMRI